MRCQHCQKECKNSNSHLNHERTCPLNPNRNYKNGMIGKVAWNKGLTKETDERIASYGKTISKVRAGQGQSGCCAWSTEERSVAAKQQGFGGYRPNAGRSKKFRVLDSFGKEVVLQSSYELRCSEILNELGISWIRPGHLKYDGRKYFPDFYLPDFDIYLDPKNSYKDILDREKIDKVIEQNEVRVFVLLEEHLTHKHLKILL